MIPLKSKREINFLKIEDKNYPLLLKEIANPPKGIYFLGNLSDEEIIMRPKVAIVGTRKATMSGKSLARKLSKILSECGIIVVSGLAMGIDTAAHEGAVSINKKTIAVLANGLDMIYPAQNENLANQILELGGAIVSEYSPGTPAMPFQFLERNRIVSGFSTATIVIEAPMESGSLVAARLAAEQGRDVMVFPGPIDHPNYKGSHGLLRDGARLVSSIEDVLEDLGLDQRLEIEGKKEQLVLDLKKSTKNDEEKAILEILIKAGEPIRIDKIVELTKLEPHIINRLLALLLIDNTIKETEKGYTI